MADSDQTKRIATIRQATAADLPVARELLSFRDEREWDQASADWFLCDLDPQRCLAWMAFAGDEPVGFSSMYVRTLNVQGEAKRVGYWANLYVHPAFRDQMLYPRLPMAMGQGLKPAGLEFFYAAVRQRDVAATHLRIGFGFITRFSVLLKPLRPARLIAKHKKLGSIAQALAWPADLLFRAYLAIKKPRGDQDGVATAIALESDEVDAVVAMLNAQGEGCMAQQWTVEAFRDRFSRTREGGAYALLGVKKGSQLVAFVLWRMAERGEAINAGVIMAAAGEPSCIASALAQAEREAFERGAELMLMMDGMGERYSRLFRGVGYRTSPETYDLLIWPKVKLTADPRLADAAQWRIGFADHDAF